MAKNESKKVSISFMDKVMDGMTNITTKQWFEMDIKIKRSISLADMIEMVDEVVSCCFMDDGSYHPEMKDFVLRCNVITRYANFTLPESLEHKYALVYNTDAFDFVRGNINTDQLTSIEIAIDDKIAFLCDTNAAGIEKKMADVLGTFEQLQEQFEKLFGGVSAGDIAKFASAIASDKFSEDNVVRAYIEQMKNK